LKRKFSEVCPKLDEVLKKFGTAIKEKHIELNNLQMAAPVMEAPPDEAHIKKILEEIKKSPTNQVMRRKISCSYGMDTHVTSGRHKYFLCIAPKKRGRP
jgi:hypothetical protein